MGELVEGTSCVRSRVEDDQLLIAPAKNLPVAHPLPLGNRSRVGGKENNTPLTLKSE